MTATPLGIAGASEFHARAICHEQHRLGYKSAPDPHPRGGRGPCCVVAKPPPRSLFLYLKHYPRRLKSSREHSE